MVTPPSKEFLQKVTLFIIRKKRYRNVLELCKNPSGVGWIFGTLPHKVSMRHLFTILHTLEEAGFLLRNDAGKVYKWSTTERGLRILKEYPADKPKAQWVVGV